jgi:hypothetical protein
MSDNHEQQFLDMAKLAGESAAPTTKRGKVTYTLAGLEADPTFEIPKAWVKHVFLDGEQASFWFWYKLDLVTPPQGMSRGELQDSKTAVRVMIKTPNGALVAATYHVAHKNGSTGTFSTVWPLKHATLEPEQKPKHQKTSKSDAKHAKDAKVPADFSASAPEPVAVVFVSAQDFSSAPTPANVGSLLRKLAGFVAPAKAKRTVALLAGNMMELHTRWADEFAAGTPDVREMANGFHFSRSNFEPDSLDLEKILHWVARGNEAAVVLAYQNATVVNAPLPHMAFNDDSWPASLAAADDALVAAFSPARSTTTTEPDSSDNEHSAQESAAPEVSAQEVAAPEVAAPAAQEVVDLTLDFDQSDDSAHSATAPAPRAAKKRKTPEQVEYIDLDD